MAILLGCLAIIAIMLLLSAGIGFIFMLVWNAVMPSLFGAPMLDFWQAWALWLLIGIIGSAFRSVFHGGK